MQRASFVSRILAVLITSFALVLAAGCDGGGSMEEPPPEEGSVDDVRINEIHEGDQWVELFNTGDASVDVSDLWLCVRPNYTQIADLNALSGSTTIPAGGFLVVEWDAIQSGEGEVGLYESDAFASSDAMLDYVQYGAAGQGRASVAVAAGLWTEGMFVASAAEGQTLAFFGGGSTPVENWGFGAPTQGTANQQSDKQAVQYALAANTNSGALPDGVSATATFQALGDAQTLVTLTLNEGATGMNVVHPAHIHLNSASEGGAIEIYLAPLDGLAQSNNGTTSSKIIDRPFEEMLRFGGHINIHESNADLGNIIARGDIGANATGTAVEAVPAVRTFQSVTYGLDPYANNGTLSNGVSATARFREMSDGKTLVTLRLTDGPTDTQLGHPAHIHLNSASEGGAIEVYLTPIDGLAHPSNDATSSTVVDRSYSDLANFDGHINIHESNVNLENVIALGDVGANADGGGGDGGGGGY